MQTCLKDGYIGTLRKRNGDLAIIAGGLSERETVGHFVRFGELVESTNFEDRVDGFEAIMKNGKMQVRIELSGEKASGFMANRTRRELERLMKGSGIAQNFIHSEVG